MRLSRRASFVYQAQRQLHLVPSPEFAFELHGFRRVRSPAGHNQNLAWLAPTVDAIIAVGKALIAEAVT